MDQPKTRQEKKKDPKEKKGGPFSSKHVRVQETLMNSLSVAFHQHRQTCGNQNHSSK